MTHSMTKEISQWFLPGLQNVLPFESPEFLDFSRLHLNEGLPPSPLFNEICKQTLDEMLNGAYSLNYYPFLSHPGLQEAFSNYLEVPENYIEVVGGSSEALLIFGAGCYREGKKVAYPRPSYYMYEKCIKIFGATGVPYSIPIPFNESQLLKELYSSSVTQSDIAIFCNPNNPTGSCLSPDIIEDFIKNFSGLVIVDEAYQEYSHLDGIPSLVKKTQTYKNLVVLRTLSKAWSAAGIRVAAVIAHPELLYQIKKLRTYRLSSFSQFFADKLLRNYTSEMWENVKKSNQLRINFENNLRKIKNVEVFPTHTNFVFFQYPRAIQLEQILAHDQKILIRNSFGNYLRISVLSESIHQEIIGAIHKLNDL